MKKVILTVTVFALGIFASFAQDNDSKRTKEKASSSDFGFKNSNGVGFGVSDVFVSGTIEYSSSTNNNSSAEGKVFTFAPKAGYFLTEDIALGLQVGYSSEQNRSANIITLDEDRFSIGAFGRYYVSPASKFSVFGQLGVNYVTAKQLVPATVPAQGIVENKANGFNFAIAPGMNYFVSNHFAIEVFMGVIGYDSMKPDVGGAKRINKFNAGISLDNLNVGLLYKF